MAYKEFANGYPLYASEINSYLMNQSVIVFADSTARSAAITSPIEGMITYLEDTDTVEVYNGTAWTDINDNTAAIPKSTVTANGDLIVADGASSVTNLSVGANGSLLYSDGTDPSWLANSGTEGDVLQVNATGGVEWVTPSGGGGWTLLGSAAMASASTVEITGLDQTYKNLRIETEGMKYNSNTVLSVRVKNGTTNLQHFFATIRSAASWQHDQGYGYLWGNATLDSFVDNPLVWDINNYARDDIHKPWIMFGGTQFSNSIEGGGLAAGKVNNDLPINAVSFQTVTDVFYAGTLKIYGGN